MPVTFPVSPELQVADWSVRPDYTKGPRKGPRKAYWGPWPGDTRGDHDMVAAACEKPSASFKVLQGSVASHEYASMVPQSNGFVQAVVHAYGTHSHLRIRPDDVWIAILCQLSFYVNAHAEELREYFVSHDGQQSLSLDACGDFGEIARKFTAEMKKYFSDNTLSEWILPDFSTTTLKDHTVCSVLMMATCKAYFKFAIMITCGFPSVTLEGTKEDWQRLLNRTRRLYEFGDQPAVWAEMLRPILRRFVAAFDGNPDVMFWKHAVHHSVEGCGEEVLTGWITAFCVWTPKGRWQAGPLPQNIPLARKQPHLSVREAITSENTAKDTSANTGDNANTAGATNSTDDAMPESGGSVLVRPINIFRDRYQYMLDGISYFTIRFTDIPAGYGEVDVTINDDGIERSCSMVAGNLAFSVMESTSGGKLDTISPSPQWYMLEKVDTWKGAYGYGAYYPRPPERRSHKTPPF